jgi:hypothetical protein
MMDTTIEVLQLAQMYVARGYNPRGWITNACDHCGAGETLIDIDEWERVDATSLCDAVSLACMEIWGEWFERLEYDEALNKLMTSSGAENFDQLVEMESTQSWALGILEKALT